MKILFVNGHLHIGGVEKSLVNLLKSIDYSIHQVDLLLVEDLGPYRDEIPRQVRLFYYDLKPTYGSFRTVLKRAAEERDIFLGYQKIIITLANKRNKKYLSFLKLPKELRTEYDCAIAYRVGMPLDLVSFSIKAKTKCAWWHHGDFNYSTSEINTWNEAFTHIDHIVCVSNSSKKMIGPHFPEQVKKMCVLPNMIIPEEIRLNADAFDPYTKEINKRILVSVSRMSAEKHMADTVEVMKKLINRGITDIVWYLVGDGIERDRIEEKIRGYELSKNFRIVGNQVNPYPYIKKADLFVHPSWVESQGLCVLEAMALGKPCVVVRSKGTEEFVQDGYNAFLADQSIEDLVEKVDHAISNLKEIELSAGQEETIERFSAEKIVSCFFYLIQTWLEKEK